MRNLPLGPLMIDVAGLTLTAEEAEVLQHPSVGGMILFGRNYDDPEQLAELIVQIRKARPDILISVDHEGGRVQRFRDGFTVLPAVGELGSQYIDDPAQAIKQAETAGWLMAAELRAIDVDFSFAPVLDVDHGVSEVIGNRAFANTSDAVTKLATAYIKGMAQAGMAAVGKHFPGHGAVSVDSHIGFPVDERSLAEITAGDQIPFAALIKSGALTGIMPAHVVYAAVDDQPAGFSHFWLQQVLRDKLGFDGAILSDDLSMAGASLAGDCIARVEAALAAGCDMGLVCNDPAAAVAVIDNVKIKADNLRSARLAALRGRGQITRQALFDSKQWQQAVAVVTAEKKGDIV